MTPDPVSPAVVHLNLVVSWCINLVMKEQESIYRQLSGLSKIRKDNPPPPPDPPPKKVEPDEMTIFYDAMKDVREIARRKDRVAPKTDKNHAFPQDGLDTARLLKDAIDDHRSFPVANLPEYMEGHVEGINPLTMEKLRNGEFSVQKTLDLHGYTVPDGYLLFQDFLKEAILSGLNCVKVIHGRGLKSKDGPVLKEKLKEWIIKAMHRKWIVAFSSSRMCEGGPGATSILLRRKPEKKKMRITG